MKLKMHKALTQILNSSREQILSVCKTLSWTFKKMKMAAQLRDSFYSFKSLEHTGQRHLSICLKWMEMDLWECLVSLFQCTIQHCKTLTATQFIPENANRVPYITDWRKSIGNWYEQISYKHYVVLNFSIFWIQKSLWQRSKDYQVCFSV